MLGYLASQNAIAGRNPGQAAGKATLALDDFSLECSGPTKARPGSGFLPQQHRTRLFPTFQTFAQTGGPAYGWSDISP
jgi:hypothetical protein